MYPQLKIPYAKIIDMNRRKEAKKVIVYYDNTKYFKPIRMEIK